MADYSYQDLMKMQNDAIRRAEDMQRRARQSAGLEKENVENQQNQTTKKEEPRRVQMPNDYLENLKNYGSNSSKNESKQKEKEDDKKDNTKDNTKRYKNEQKNNNQPNFQNSFEDKMKSVFGDLNIDSDKALLLSLILLLSEEKADELLIMALIYMLT